MTFNLPDLARDEIERRLRRFAVVEDAIHAREPQYAFHRFSSAAESDFSVRGQLLERGDNRPQATAVDELDVRDIQNESRNAVTNKRKQPRFELLRPARIDASLDRFDDHDPIATVALYVDNNVHRGPERIPTERRPATSETRRLCLSIDRDLAEDHSQSVSESNSFGVPRSNDFAARETISMAMLSDAVAAGDGALQT